MTATRKWAIALLGLVLTLSACSKKEDAPLPTVTSGASPSAGNKLSYVYIPKQTGNPYFDSVDKGLDAACKEIGAPYKMTGPATADATSQVPFIQDQVQAGVKVLVLTPNSPDALNSYLDDARAKGVKIITVDADLTGNESHRDAAVNSTDQDKIGPSQIELLGSMINYEGNFAILSATTDAPNQNYWIKGMIETLKDPKYAKMHLVDTVYGDDQPEKSRKEAEGLLTKYPDLKGILAPTSVGVEQAAKAIEAAGVYPGGPNAKNGGVVVTGLGTPNQMRDYINRNIISAVALWDPGQMGRVAAYLGKGLADGTITAAPGNTFTIPGSDEKFTFSKTNGVNAGPPLTFRKDNIGNFNF